MTELKPCPFCGGKASIKYKWLSKAGRTIAPPVEVMEEQGLNAWFGQHQYIERYKYSVKAICNRCHARGKPVVATVEKYTPYSTTEEAVKAMGINASVEKVTDIEKIISYGVMRTPALVVDEKVLSVGKVLTVEEVMSILKAI